MFCFLFVVVVFVVVFVVVVVDVFVVVFVVAFVVVLQVQEPKYQSTTDTYENMMLGRKGKYRRS